MVVAQRALRPKISPHTEPHATPRQASPVNAWRSCVLVERYISAFLASGLGSGRPRGWLTPMTSFAPPSNVYFSYAEKEIPVWGPFSVWGKLATLPLWD